MECTGQRWAQTASEVVWPNPCIGRPTTEAVQAHLWREDRSYPLGGGLYSGGGGVGATPHIHIHGSLIHRKEVE